MKNTIGKHIVKVGYIIRPNVEYANMRDYEKQILEKASYNDKIIELKIN